MICSVESCGRAVKSRGWCEMHYMRWVRRGDLTSTRDVPVDSYGATHARLRRLRGPANANPCRCGTRAAEWSYQGCCPLERWGWSNATGARVFAAYSPDPDRYEPLCRRCHANQGPPLLAMLAERAADRAMMAACSAPVSEGAHNVK